MKAGEIVQTGTPVEAVSRGRSQPFAAISFALLHVGMKTGCPGRGARGPRDLLAGAVHRDANGANDRGRGKGFDSGPAPTFVSFASEVACRSTGVKVLDTGAFRIVENGARPANVKEWARSGG